MFMKSHFQEYCMLSFTTNICVQLYTSQTALILITALNLMFWSALRYPVERVVNRMTEVVKMNVRLVFWPVSFRDSAHLM